MSQTEETHQLRKQVMKKIEEQSARQEELARSLHQLSTKFDTVMKRQATSDEKLADVHEVINNLMGDITRAAQAQLELDRCSPQNGAGAPTVHTTHMPFTSFTSNVRQQ
jgi:seryl-tRNA synthetase